MAVTPISALPTAPNRGMLQTLFSSTMDAFLAALPGFVNQANVLAGQVDADAVQTAADRVQTGLDVLSANASATAASASSTNTTSTTSNDITGAVGVDKTFTVAAGKSIVPGMNYVAAQTSNPTTKALMGIVKSYSGTTLVLTVGSILGSGIGITDWTLSLASSAQGISAASGSAVLLGTSGTVGITPAALYTGLAEVALTDAATIAVDMSTFLNATVTLAGNRTLGNPTNAKPGQGGRIRVVQDGTGSRTLAFGANWKREGGAAVLSTTAAAEDYIYYDVVTASKIVYSFVKAPS